MFDIERPVDGRILTNLPAPYIFGIVIKVRDYETDSQGIVNNANYLHYLELSRHAFCEWRGFSFKEMSEAGILAVMRRVELDYLTSLRGGDYFASCLWVERRGARFVFHQDFFKLPTGEKVSEGTVTVVACRDGHLTKGDELAEKLNIGN